MLVKNNFSNDFEKSDGDQNFCVGNESLLQKGYGMLPNIVLFDEKLSSTAKLLYCLISSLSAEKGFCYASNDYLAKKTGKNKKSITRLINELKKYLRIENPQSYKRRIYLSLTSSKMRSNILKNEEVNILKNEEHNNISINNINIIGKVFSFWNEKKSLIKHRSLTQKMKIKINSALRDYSEDEVQEAIAKYDFVLSGKEYFWNYRWTLDEFLVRGLTKFLEKPLDEFKNFDSRSDDDIENERNNQRVEEFNRVWKERVSKCGKCKNGFIQGLNGRMQKCECVSDLKKDFVFI